MLHLAYRRLYFTYLRHTLLCGNVKTSERFLKNESKQNLFAFLLNQLQTRFYQSYNIDNKTYRTNTYKVIQFPFY